MGKIVALGGGVFIGKEEKLMPVEMRPVHQEIIRLTEKQHPNVLYIPTAADDSEDHIKTFQKYYTKLGCKVNVLRLSSERPSQAEIRTKILSADAIYITGGKTFRMMRKWERYGVDVLLKQAYARGTVMAGHSAGAICWFNYGCSDSFSDSRFVSMRKPFRVTALGIINALLCPHYDSEPVRQPALKRIMKRTPGMVALALDEYAAIEIVDGKYRIIAAKPTAQARRTYWSKDRYIIEAIKPDVQFGSLASLLK